MDKKQVLSKFLSGEIDSKQLRELLASKQPILWLSVSKPVNPYNAPIIQFGNTSTQWIKEIF